MSAQRVEPDPIAGIERFTAAAAAAGLVVEVRRFSQGTRTAADAAAAIGCEVAAIVKSVVFVASAEGRDWPVLVLTSGAHRADMGAVADAVGCEALRQAKPGEVLDATGFVVGAVAPLGHPRPLPTWIDETLLEFPVVYAAAGSVDSITPVVSRDLLAATGAVPIRFGESSGSNATTTPEAERTSSR